MIDLFNRKVGVMAGIDQNIDNWVASNYPDGIYRGCPESNDAEVRDKRPDMDPPRTAVSVGILANSSRFIARRAETSNLVTGPTSRA